MARPDRTAGAARSARLGGFREKATARLGCGLRLAALYAAVVSLGICALAAALRLGVLSNFDILFYRGLILIGLITILLFVAAALLLPRFKAGLGVRDAFAAAVLSFSLNLSFLVVVPVTVDRSISTFLLGAMAQHPDEALTGDQASQLFKSVYVDGYRQIDRRLREQTVSGNLERVGDAYRISARGLAFVATAKFVGWLFDSRAGLIDPQAPATDRRAGGPQRDR